MLEVTNLSYAYGARMALQHITFAADHGIIGILGRNGAGKSTLLAILATVLKPTTGAVLFDNNDALAMPASLRRATAYLPQSITYPPNVSARAYVRYLLALRGIDSQAGDHWLEQLGLEHVADQKMDQYSGSMRQRVGLAYALACNTRIILLDEPIQGLDPWERTRFHKLLAQLAIDHLIVFSTHIVSDIEAITDRVIVLDGGKLCYDGTARGLFQQQAAPVWLLCAKHMPLFLDTYTITNVRQYRDGTVEIRGVGGPIPARARIVTTTLEDAYLHMTNHAFRVEHEVALQEA